MIKVAICHEKELTRTLLRTYCTDYLCIRGILYEIKEYTSGESMLLEDFPDVLFLGVETGQVDGLLVKEVLEKLKAETRVIFVAEQKECMGEAFGKNVYGFWPGVVKYTSFRRKMTEILLDYYEQHRCIFCKKGKEIYRVPLLEVLYVEAYGKYTKVYTTKETDYFLCDKCMGDWIVDEEESEFLWCHRKYLVNILHIFRMRNCSIELENGTFVPFSRKRRKECYCTYQHFIGRIKVYEERNGSVYCNIKAEL